MSAVQKAWTFLALVLVLGVLSLLTAGRVEALNILEYKDTLSDSGPNFQSNHTFDFRLNTDVSPGGVIEITPPAGFEILATSTFAIRNVEMYVDGTPRPAAATAAAGVDQVEITPGTPGLLRYTLAPDSGLSNGERIQFRVGNHTSNAVPASVTYSTSTGTTTTAGDVEPIVNSATVGTHEVRMEIYDGGLVARAGFLIAIVEKVSVPNVDTTEVVPPYRFNGAPTSTVGGTTLSVELSLETDELAVCRYDTVAGTDFNSMSLVFANTGFVFHSQVVSVTPNTTETFYVRCIDDEGNFNTDDFIITFTVNDTPTGDPNTEGDVEGSGTGSGNEGSGTGSGAGGSTGGSDGEEPEEGEDEGSGGSGGGGGGGSGGDDGDTAGGGFESTDAPYQSGDGRVIISGHAYPNSTVTTLVDGKVAQTVRSNSTGVYSLTLDEIARGAYTFGVYAEGPDAVRSSTFSTSFTVTGARTSTLSNVNVAPSIKVSPNPVSPGQTVTFSGYGLPNSNITLENGKVNTGGTAITATADASGKWTATTNTDGFSVGTYQVRAKSVQTSGVSTNFSNYTFYGVGQSASVPLNADLNRDGRVNLTDFSILLFWWNGSGGDSDPPADINRDGRVNLTDFSIMLFNWTG
ncbi:MAG: dockerin type I domain-containing protein [Patescibacteria group bacterium]